MTTDDRMLRDLSVRYADAVDRRDPEALVRLFTPDAVLTVMPEPGSDRPERRMTGKEEIRRITTNIGRYRRTFHFLGQSQYNIDGATAVGQVYCIAHHLEDNTNYVMYIRYQDRYVEASGGDWRIADRRLILDWSERRPLG